MNIRTFAWALFPICEFGSNDLIVERVHLHLMNTIGDDFLKKVSQFEIGELENSRDQLIAICNKLILDELDANLDGTKNFLKSYYRAISQDSKIFELVFNRKFSKPGEKCLYWGFQCDAPQGKNE